MDPITIGALVGAGLGLVSGYNKKQGQMRENRAKSMMNLAGQRYLPTQLANPWMSAVGGGLAGATIGSSGMLGGNKTVPITEGTVSETPETSPETAAVSGAASGMTTGRAPQSEGLPDAIGPEEILGDGGIMRDPMFQKDLLKGAMQAAVLKSALSSGKKEAPEQQMQQAQKTIERDPQIAAIIAQLMQNYRARG